MPFDGENVVSKGDGAKRRSRLGRRRKNDVNDVHALICVLIAHGGKMLFLLGASNALDIFTYLQQSLATRAFA